VKTNANTVKHHSALHLNTGRGAVCIITCLFAINTELCVHAVSWGPLNVCFYERMTDGYTRKGELRAALL